MVRIAFTCISLLIATPAFSGTCNFSGMNFDQAFASSKADAYSSPEKKEKFSDLVDDFDFGIKNLRASGYSFNLIFDHVLLKERFAKAASARAARGLSPIVGRPTGETSFSGKEITIYVSEETSCPDFYHELVHAISIPLVQRSEIFTFSPSDALRESRSLSSTLKRYPDWREFIAYTLTDKKENSHRPALLSLFHRLVVLSSEE